MANKTVIIAAIKDSEKWFNITDNNKVEYGIYKEKCPKLTALLATLKEGDEITGNHSTGKEGKNFLWDLDEKKGGGKSFAPKDKGFDAALASANAAASLLALSKDVSKEKFDEWFEHIHTKIMNKATKPTETN